MKVGDWVILNNYGLKSVEITRLTDKCLYHNMSWGGYGRVKRNGSSIVFNGTKDECDRLLEQLKSARAQRDKEERDVALRYQKRWEEIVQKAVGRQNSLLKPASTPAPLPPPGTPEHAKATREGADAHAALKPFA